VSAPPSVLTLTQRIGPGSVLRQGTAAAYRRLSLIDGESHTVRTDLTGERPSDASTAVHRPLLCFAHLTDLQLADVQSPARFEFFNREFADPRFAALVPVQRPQEALTPHAVDAMIRAINAVAGGPATGLPPELVVTTGDGIDNAQWNELRAMLDLFDGRPVRLDSGAPGYEGVQSVGWPDDIFWRPDPGSQAPDLWRSAFGFPEHPGLLDAAITAFRASGLQLPWLACHGNHEALIQGVARITPEIAAAMVGGWKPSRRLAEVSPDVALEVFTDAVQTFMAGEPLPVGPDAARRPITRREFVEAHFGTASSPQGHGFTETNRRGGTAYFVHEAGMVRFVVLDTACVEGGADGAIDEDQGGWLEGVLADAHSSYRAEDGSVVRTSSEDRLVVLVSHHGSDMLTNHRAERGGGVGRLGRPEMLALVHRFGNVVLWINGHTHANEIRPRPHPTEPGRGFWEVTTSSIVDWPCQARLVELFDAGDGSLAIACTMLDHDGPVDAIGGPGGTGGIWPSSELAGLHRELAANVPWAGADSGREGRPIDRNAILRLRAPFPRDRAASA
jgi:metallophosphoesterase (TIGR03767 family)